MVIRSLILIAILGFSRLLAQDSLDIKTTNQYYNQFFVTDLMGISTSGKHMVLLNSNAYGKEEYKIFNSLTQQSDSIVKGSHYDFLGDDKLLVKTMTFVRFLDLKHHKSTDVQGVFEYKILPTIKMVVLFNKPNNTLACYNQEGLKIWEKKGVKDYRLTKDEKSIIFYKEKKLVCIDLLTGNSSNAMTEKTISWIKEKDHEIYGLNAEQEQLQLYRWKPESGHFRTFDITIPQGYVFAEDRSSEIEFKEGAYVYIPLGKRQDKATQSHPYDPIISYTTDKNPFNNITTAGVYNLKNETWQWLPAIDAEEQRQFIMGSKGTMLILSPDEKTNQLTKPYYHISLVLNYGREKIEIGSGRSSPDNYHWDDDSQTLLFFVDKEWWYYSVLTGKKTQLMPLSEQSLVLDWYNGLTDMPVQKIVPTSEPSKIIITGAFDLFLVDLKNLKVKRLTQGFEKNMVYRIWKPRADYSADSNLSLINLKEGILLTVQNQSNYHSGFALLNTKLHTLVYGEESYRDLTKVGNNLFALSQSYQQPLKITKIGLHSPQVIFDSRLLQQEQLCDCQFKLLQYKTKTGSSNMALLYPKDYDPQKKYPMVVNIYEKKSRDVLFYSVPDLQASDGFNLMHYVHQGYFVLLPDLQYEVGNVPGQMMISLEASVKKALEEGHIDESNIAIVGMSFGGYEAGFALVNTDLFKTGSLGVMVSNLISFSLSQTPILKEPNYIRVENDQFGMNESLFDNWNHYLLMSPVRNLKNVNRPVFLWTGSMDNNVPPQQTREYFFGLKRLGKKAVMLEYPMDGHFMFRNETKEDLSVRTWQWMEHFLKGKPSAEWMAPKK